MDNNIEQELSPSARAAHHRGQMNSVVPARPGAPITSAGVLLATSGATMASFYVRPHTPPLLMHVRLKFPQQR